MSFEDRTLTEIQEHHEDNWRSIQEGFSRKALPSIVYAIEYRTQAFQRAMDALGFSPAMIMNLSTSRDTAEGVIDNMLEKHKIVIEDWSDTDVEESKRGLYIFKDNEIAYFVSDITKDGSNYIVSSNVKM